MKKVGSNETQSDQQQHDGMGCTPTPVDCDVDAWYSRQGSVTTDDGRSIDRYG